MHVYITVGWQRDDTCTVTRAWTGNKLVMEPWVAYLEACGRKQ